MGSAISFASPCAKLTPRDRPVFVLRAPGPKLEVGTKCQALDIRMTWCEAEVVGTRTVESGRDEYRMHYVGWKKNWDEWVARDSGRIRQVSSGSKQPSPAKTPGGTKVASARKLVQRQRGADCGDSGGGRRGRAGWKQQRGRAGGGGGDDGGR